MPPTHPTDRQVGVWFICLSKNSRFQISMLLVAFTTAKRNLLGDKSLIIMFCRKSASGIMLKSISFYERGGQYKEGVLSNMKLIPCLSFSLFFYTILSLCFPMFTATPITKNQAVLPVPVGKDFYRFYQFYFSFKYLDINKENITHRKLRCSDPCNFLPTLAK